MKTKLFLTLAAAAIVLAGCNKDDNEVVDNWNGEIRLSSGVSLQQTRAFSSMDTQLPNGQTVAVYVDKVNGGTEIYGNNVLTANGSGAFTGGTTMFFPEDKSNVNIYAFHTNGTLAVQFPALAITHTVKADQSAEANYLSSDLLYAANKAVAYTKSAVPLTFYHMLAKVQVAIKSGNGNPDLTGATLSIAGTKLKADFTPNKTKDLTSQFDRAGMISTTSSNNDAIDIKVSNAATTDFNSPTYNDAIIVPQTLNKDAVFIKVKLNSGTELTHKLADVTTFGSGKKYQYHITVNLSGLSVTSIISNWEAINSVTGDAEM